MKTYMLEEEEDVACVKRRRPYVPIVDEVLNRMSDFFSLGQ